MEYYCIAVAIGIIICFVIYAANLEGKLAKMTEDRDKWKDYGQMRQAQRDASNDALHTLRAELRRLSDG